MKVYKKIVKSNKSRTQSNPVGNKYSFSKLNRISMYNFSPQFSLSVNKLEILISKISKLYLKIVKKKKKKNILTITVIWIVSKIKLKNHKK